jgi:hypothetical protein
MEGRMPNDPTFGGGEVQALLQPYIQSDLITPHRVKENPQPYTATPKCTKCGAEIPFASLQVLRGRALRQIRTQPG